LPDRISLPAQTSPKGIIIRKNIDMNSLDIIIVNYNSTDHLLNCLRTVEKSLGDLCANIFVQDNASTDSVCRILSEFPRVILTQNRHNLGFARAVNQALRKGAGDYVVLLNPDACIVDNFFETSLSFMQKNSGAGVMGPRILDNDGRLQNSARAFPTPLTAFFGRSSFLSRRFPENPVTSRNLLSLKSDGKSPMKVDWVSGACMVIRRKAIDDTGLLDERFFMYWEDADWCRRIWKHGWKVVYNPQATVYHYVGGSSEKNIFRSVIEFHKSVYRLFDKYLDSSLSFLKPLVIGGLTIRLFFVLVSNLFQWSFSIFNKRHPKFSDTQPQVLSADIQLPENKIKILRIISRLNIGGPSIHVHLLTNGLNAERFDSKLVTGKISPQEGDMSYLFHYYDKQPIIVPELQREISLRMDMKAFIQILKIIFREKPDILHTHTAKAGSSSRFAGLLCNILSSHQVHMVHTFHGHVFEGYFSKVNSLLFLNIERFLARVTDVVIAISETQKHELAEKYRIAPASKIRTLELGFDLRPFFSGKSMKGAFRQSLGIDEDTLLIGIVGRLVPIKNHEMFFKAAGLFLEQNPGIQVQFIIVGDGELRNELKACCQKQGLTRYIKFCGWVKNVPFVYADLDILALTSLNEGTPVSIIESMAASVPVIATDAGGVQDLMGKKLETGKVESGKRKAESGIPKGEFFICERGVLCRKNDAAGFAKGLRYLTEADAGETVAMVRRARSFAEKRFDHKRLFYDMESLYTELMTYDK